MEGRTISFEVSHEVHVVIAASAILRGLSIAQFIVRAVHVYNTLIKEQDAGNIIYVGTKDRITKEITLP